VGAAAADGRLHGIASPCASSTPARRSLRVAGYRVRRLLWSIRSIRRLVRCLSGGGQLAVALSVPHTRPFDSHFTSRDESPQGGRRPIETCIAIVQCCPYPRLPSRICAVCEGVGCVARAPARAVRRRRGPATARVVGILRGARRGTGGCVDVARARAALGPWRPSEGGLGWQWQVGVEVGISTRIGAEQSVAAAPAWPR
jgi:hypothetical protein